MVCELCGALRARTAHQSLFIGYRKILAHARALGRAICRQPATVELPKGPPGISSRTAALRKSVWSISLQQTHVHS
jgi:hypothetical protein